MPYIICCTQYVCFSIMKFRVKRQQSGPSPLDEALEQAVQDVAAVPHEPDVLRRAVDALAVQDGPLKHVAELLPRAQEVGPHEVHHAPVLQQVVLQRVAGQHHAPPRPDVLQGL